jgi:hypothetical protein
MYIYIIYIYIHTYIHTYTHMELVMDVSIASDCLHLAASLLSILL